MKNLKKYLPLSLLVFGLFACGKPPSDSSSPSPSSSDTSSPSASPSASSTSSMSSPSATH